MARLDTFTMRVDEDEKKMIAALADKLQRNQSDAVRWLIRNAIQEIERDNADNPGASPQNWQG